MPFTECVTWCPFITDFPFQLVITKIDLHANNHHHLLSCSFLKVLSLALHVHPLLLNHRLQGNPPWMSRELVHVHTLPPSAVLYFLLYSALWLLAALVSSDFEIHLFNSGDFLFEFPFSGCDLKNSFQGVNWDNPSTHLSCLTLS